MLKVSRQAPMPQTELAETIIRHYFSITNNCRIVNLGGFKLISFAITASNIIFQASRKSEIS